MKRLLFLMTAFAAVASASPVRIAVSLDPPQDNNAAVIEPTLNRLRATFAVEGIEVVPLKLPALETALAERKVDLFLSTSGLARRMAGHGTRDLVTLVSDRLPDPNKAYGSVFIVRKDSSFQSLQDLKGKRLAANMPGGFYGYQIAMGELVRQGFRPDSFFSSTEFFGRDLHTVVDAVLSGKADVGTLSSCFLEDAYPENSPQRQLLRAINVRPDSGACLRSTELYPNWSVSTTPSTPSDISRRAAQALLAMPAAEDGLRWSIATDFSTTDQLFRDLRVGPFAFLRGYFRTEFMKRYGIWLCSAAALALVLALFSLFCVWLVRLRTKALTLALAREKALKNDVRTAGEQLLAMQKISLIGQMSTTIAHELRQPLMTIKAFIHGLSKSLSEKNVSTAEILDILGKINRQVEKSDDLVERVRNYARRQKAAKTSCLLNQIVERVCSRFRKSGSFPGQISLQGMNTDCRICAVEAEIELALTNILQNAAEALKNKQPSRQHILVTLRTDHTTACLTVSDNGDKLSAQARHALQVPLSSDKVEGLGLGLSIVASVVENHNGRLTITENPTGGITVSLSFPLEVSQP